MRCLTLAEAMRARGARVLFVSRLHEGHLCDLVEGHGLEVARLPPPAKEASHADSQLPSWLGIAWQKDAEQTAHAIATLCRAQPDWLVVDHYGLDSRWEMALRAHSRRILVIDDLADRMHDCDLLLDQNIVADADARYSHKIPAACGLMLGPQYALLQPQYADLHDRIPPRAGPITRILIYFGGIDRANLTGKTLEAFLRVHQHPILVDAVIPSGSPHVEAIRKQILGHANIRLHSNLKTLAPLIARADLAIGAGGTTTWERLCLGLPALVITLAANQRPIAEELERRKLIRWLGHCDQVDSEQIGQALGELIRCGMQEDWSSDCRSAVDGLGTARVCAVLLVDRTTPIKVRHATLQDEALLLSWANDPNTRRNSFSPDPIAPSTHRAWFHARLRNAEGCHLYIGLTPDDVPIGQVRFERETDAWHIHYAVAPLFRGRGLGRCLLQTALQQLGRYASRAVVVATVKEDNHASHKVFQSLGFTALPSHLEASKVYRRTLFNKARAS